MAVGLSMHRLQAVGISLLAASMSAIVATGQTPESSPLATTRLTPARVPRVLPGTRESAFTTIHGNALDFTNNALPDNRVRLRDARFGGIVESQVTDKAGMFSFRSLDPGTYVVELVAEDRAVLAASQLLSIGAGEVLLAVVKLPLRIPALGGLLAHTAQQAAAVTSAAAASGVLSTSVTGVDASAR